jgi:hypothetical protein
MTQYNLKLGIRKFVEHNAKVSVSELTELHSTDTWAVMDPSTLTKEDDPKHIVTSIPEGEMLWQNQRASMH